MTGTILSKGKSRQTRMLAQGQVNVGHWANINPALGQHILCALLSLLMIYHSFNKDSFVLCQVTSRLIAQCWAKVVPAMDQ